MTTTYDAQAGYAQEQRAAMRTFRRAERWLNGAVNDARIDSWERDTYLEEMRKIAPEGWLGDPRTLTAERTGEWQRAVLRLRARAYYRYWYFSDFCMEGLNDFLRDTGLPIVPYQGKPNALDRAKGRMDGDEQ